MNKISLFILLLLLNFVVYAQQKLEPLEHTKEPTTDIIVQTTNQDQSTDILAAYSSLLPHEDSYILYKPEDFGINEKYASRLADNSNLHFFIESIDKHAITQNSNITLRFPYTFIPYGGAELFFNSNTEYHARRIDFGFIHRMETNKAGNFSYTVLNQFDTLGSFSTYAKLEFFPETLEKHNLRGYVNAAIDTTAPQYALVYNYYAPKGEYISKAFKKIKFGLTEQNSTGFSLGGGLRALIPWHHIISDSAIRFDYNYVNALLSSAYNKKYPPASQKVEVHQAAIVLNQQFTYSKQQQTKTLRTGFALVGTGSASFPILDIQEPYQPQLSARIGMVYNKKLYKEFAIKTRIITAAHFAHRENMAGDGGIRGVQFGQMSGFLSGLVNLELLIPLVFVDVYSLADLNFPRRSHVLLDFVFFTDAGIAISKDSLKLSNIKFVHTTSEITGIKTYFDNTDIYGNYAWTVGAGLRIYPAFVHFIVRVDVGVNVLESIVFQRSPTVELVLSLNDLF